MPWIGAAISAGGSILGGLMGKDAASSASGAQQRATDMAITEARNRYNQILGMTQGYRDIGSAANNKLRSGLGLGGPAVDTLKYGNGVPIDSIDQIVGRYAPADQAGVRAALGQIGVNTPEGSRVGVWDNQAVSDALSGFQTPTSDPDAGMLTRQFNEADLAADVPYNKGLEFGLNEGRKGINERAIANGGYDSGATLKALTRFGNDYGETKAAGAQNRFTGRQSQVYNMLTGQQNVGINATNAVSGAGTNMTNQVAQLYGDQGNAQAAGIVGGANAMAGAFGGVGNAIQGYQNNNILQQLLRRGGTTGQGGTISNTGNNGGAGSYYGDGY